MNLLDDQFWVTAGTATCIPNNPYLITNNILFGPSRVGPSHTKPVFTMADIRTNPAFQVRISELEDLWRVRFGNDWVSESALVGDEFYLTASRRLQAAGRLETHTISDPWGEVYKLVD